MMNERSDSLMKQSEVSFINVRITDVLLTPLACACLVNEIFKGILYQKCQIPYPYSWMKSRIDNKRSKTDSEAVPSLNFSILNHYNIVSKAYDILENIMKNVKEEFTREDECVKEVVIVLGTTPHCPNEVFSINIDNMVKGHAERNHLVQLNEHHQKILRSIFLSQKWLDKIHSSTACTNIFIFLKKYVVQNRTDFRENMFIPSRPLVLSPKLKQFKINLCSDYSFDINCCDNLMIYGDVNNPKNTVNCGENEDNKENIVWYQAKDIVRGFKDCYINKISVSELW